MKILISDYDDTLRPLVRDSNNKVVLSNERTITDVDSLNLNITAIKEFRRKGNVFVLSTGRPFDSIKKEIVEYDLPVDYLGCSDGSFLFNSKLNLIESHLFNREQEELIDEVISSLNGDFSKDDFGLDFVSQYHMDITDMLEKDEFIAKFDKTFANVEFLDAYRLDFGYVDWLLVRPKNITKITTGYDVLKHYPNLEKDDIIAIGDGANDVPMLEEFNGYTLEHSTSKVKKICKNRVVSSVRELVSRI